MSFTSKPLNHSSRSGISFLKGATLFFLGMSVVLFAARAFEIVPLTKNMVQIMERIILTNAVGTTGIVLNGGSGSVTADIISGATICIAGDCQTSWPAGTPGGITGALQFSNGTGFSGSSSLVRTAGKLVIGTDTPSTALEVSGTGKFNNLSVNGSSYFNGGLEVKGNVKALESVIINQFEGYTETSGLFLPLLTTGNTGSWDTDSIWYISCVSGYNTTGPSLFLVGFTGANINTGYMLMPLFGSAPLTYHLKAGETLLIFPVSCDNYIAYSQKYGGTGTVINFDMPLWATGSESNFIAN